MGNKSRRRRGRAPRHHRPSAGSGVPWVLLDRIAHRTKGDGDRVFRDEVADGTLSEISSTCTGKPIAVSLRVAEAPEVSRLYLHWPDGLRPEMSRLNRPTVIAAHGDSILFETYVPLDACGLSTTCYPIDYFVYTAPSRPKIRSPSLQRLPTLFESGRVDAVMDHYCKPFLSHEQRAMWRGDIGLLCRGDGGFTVANLSVGAQPWLSLGEFSVLHHTPAETDMKWEVKQLPAPVPCDGHDGAPNLVIGGRPCSWETDIVIPFEVDGRHFLCWVDLYLGLLFVDVTAKLPPPPRYAWLPAELDQRRMYIDFGVPDPARRACVTDAGIMQLISISNDAGRSVLDRSCSAFNITTWTLELETMQWHKVATIRSDEFWAVLNTDKRLPRLLPAFPTISMVDPDDVCFTLEDSYHNFWLVNVNIKNKVLAGAVALYINEEEEEEEGRAAGVFYGNSFVTSQFTRYMDKDAIKSIELSKKLQQAKQERVMENMD
ncbi:hypothetical protein ACQJBY_057279 [Aegilops geniculata]